MTASETAQLVATLKAAFPRQEVPPETIAIYCDMLADLDASAARAAVVRILRTATYFPTIGEICQEVAKGAVGGEGAAEAWIEVKQAIGTQGYHRADQVQWSSPVVAKAVQAMGGFRAICLSEDPEGVMRAQFARFFESLKGSAVRRANLAALPAAQAPDAPQLAHAPQVAALAAQLSRRGEGGWR